MGFCYRQQLAYQAYNPQLKPLSGPAQQAHPNPKTQILPSHTLAILPSFATPQTLAAPDGSIVFLRPDPFLHDAQDIVNHSADTVKAVKQKSSAMLRGQPVNMPKPRFAPVACDDLIIALTSAADRCVAIACPTPVVVSSSHSNSISLSAMPPAFLWSKGLMLTSVCFNSAKCVFSALAAHNAEHCYAMHLNGRSAAKAAQLVVSSPQLLSQFHRISCCKTLIHCSPTIFVCTFCCP